MSGGTISVLAVDDEEAFLDALGLGLRREGFVVHLARDGREALELFEAIEPDLVLLDVMLPGQSGIDVCREIRRRSSTPVIMLSARGQEVDAVVGLEVGADDYVTKPYRMRELVARIRAVLRRAPPPSSTSTGVLEVGPVRLDPQRHEVTVGGAPVSLPLREFELLEVLMHEAGRVVTRERLIDRVWGHDYVGDTNTLDVHVRRLRAKLEEDPSQPRLLVTVRGLGYRLDVPPA